jgi:integrase
VARKIRAPKIETRTSRLALPRQRKPHGYTNVAPGIWVGYRRTQSAGTWDLKAANGKGDYWHAKIGVADDYEDADNEHVFDFWQAAERARAMARGQTAANSRPATVQAALDDYEADLRARGGDLTNASRVRHHLSAALLNKPVGLLGVSDLRKWRNRLIADGVKPATVVRVCKGLRAALNAAADSDPKRITERPWRIGLSGLTDIYTPVNKVLSDADVLRLVEAAYARDPAFGLFIETLAVTGTRTSQAASLLVADLQVARDDPRLMMPSSRKGGRGRRQITRRPVPITPALAAKLKRAAADRLSDAPLLTGADGNAWKPKSKELRDLFIGIAAQCGLKCTAYALRHSSVVRSLLAGTPTRLTASLHDTSTIILERVYSHFIADHGDAVARRGLLDTAPPGANVVTLAPGKRRR